MRQPAKANRPRVSNIGVPHAAATSHVRADPSGVNEMRTTLTEKASDRRGGEASDDQQEVARDNPRRRREPYNERENDDRRGSGPTRSPLRHGGRHVQQVG